MRFILHLIIIAAIAAAAMVGYAYSGLYDVSASSPDPGIVRWFLSTTSRESVERRATNIQPPNLDDQQLRLTGASDFEAMCAVCHGAPGRPPDALGQGLNPEPPDLAEHAAHWSPAELFWITRNGIKMTGMPAWGATHTDEEIWAVVAFLIDLPRLDESTYQEMVARARAMGMGHHPQSEAEDAHAEPAHDQHDHSH